MDIPPKITLIPLFPINVGDLPTPFDLKSQHHGNADQIDRIIKIDRFQIFIDKFHVNAIRQGCGENDRAVRGQVKFGLPLEFWPLRIDESEFHKIRYSEVKVIFFRKPENQERE